MSKITHVVSSPLRRALETTRYSFGPVFERGLKIVALPTLRQKECTPSSTGTPLDLLRRYHKHPAIDFSSLDDGWEINREKLGGESERVLKMKEELFALGTAALGGNMSTRWADFGGSSRVNEDGNVEILAVTHAGFLAALEGVEGWPLRICSEYTLLTARQRRRIDTLSSEALSLRSRWGRMGRISSIWWRRRKVENEFIRRWERVLRLGIGARVRFYHHSRQ